MIQEISYMNRPRYPFVDFLRGVAILLMIFFHFFYDLTLFGILNIDFNHDLFWFALPRLIVFLFLICVGLSLEIVHTPKRCWPNFFKRWWKVAFSATIVSLATFIFFRKNWIYFGTLHCIAVGQMIAMGFVGKRKLAFFLGLSLFIIFWGSHFQWVFPPSDLIEGRSMDFIPIFPWVGIILIGMGLTQVSLHQIPISSTHFLIRAISTLGQNSLMIYLLHQPLIYGLLWLLFQFI